MKERLITLVCAVGALMLFIAMFIQREGALGGRNEIPQPTTAERRANGYHAAMAWLEGENIRTLSLRDRFDTLAKREDLAQTGNLLIVTLPAASSFTTWEFIPLDRWIRAGNTLLILAALSDNPDWSFSQGGLASGDLNLLSGLEFESVTTRDARLGTAAAGQSKDKGQNQNKGKKEAPPPVRAAFRAFLEPVKTQIAPNRPHAYFDGVKKLVALSDYTQQLWAVKVPYEGFVLSLAHDEAHNEGALWTRPLGQGRIVVSGYGTLFTNRAIGLGDNARLLANIIGVNVAENGAVLFDDIHQGLGAAYDPDKFYKDRRLYATLGVMLALWLVWVLGSTRLRAPVSTISTPREADLIRSAGGFFARAVPVHAGARRLLENFFRRVNTLAGRGNAAVSKRNAFGSEGAPEAVPWDVLERHARIAPTDLEQLKAWYADACAAKRVPLQKLQNLLVRIDRQMAT